MGRKNRPQAPIGTVQGQQAEDTFVQPLQNALSTFLSYLPQLVGAIIILIIGYIVAKVLQAVVTRVLRGIGFENWMERGGIKQFFDRAQTRQTPTSIIGKLVFWFVFIIAITMAADALGIPQVSAVLGQLIAYIPSIIAAILILILAALLANFVSGIVRGRPAVIYWRVWRGTLSSSTRSSRPSPSSASR
jgi:small-conductance mechanosensitive channel